MSFTRTEINTRVRSIINEPSARHISDDEISRWIEDALEDISLKTFCGTIVATAFATVNGTQQYAWPSVYGPGAATTPIITLGIKTIINSAFTALEYVPMDMIGRIGQEGSYQEMKWSTWNQKIFLSPIPTAAYTLTPIIWVEHTVTSNVTLTIPPAFHHLVPMYCIAMAREKKRDYEKANLDWQRYNKSMDRIAQTITYYDIRFDNRRTLADQVPGS